MEQDSNLLEVTHFDVCSRMSAEACSEYHYVLTSQMILEQESNLLEVIHFDVCSPMSAEARSGYRYVLTSRMI